MPEVSSVSFEALGTTAIVATSVDRLDDAVGFVERDLQMVDRTCSRFRTDSDLSRLNLADGSWTIVDPVLVEAVEVSLRAARLTDGLVDPTIGETMRTIGYDRDFAEIAETGPALPASWIHAPAWRLVEVRRDRSQIRLPAGAQLDLGATAKAFAADRAAAGVSAAVGAGVLVSLGGDVAVAGPSPQGGWSIGIADDHREPGEPGETVAIASGGLATSSTTVRRWTRGGDAVHHIVDPRTGRPAAEIWRTVSVHAASCSEANVASTAAIILGADAPAWLARQALPARLVGRDGLIVRVDGWPERAVA